MFDFFAVFTIVLLLILVLNWMMPSLLPNTLQFGVRIPPDFVHHPAVLQARSVYYRWLAVITLVAIAADVALYAANTSEGMAPFWMPALILFSLLASYANYYTAHRRLGRTKKAESWYAGKKQVLVADISASQQPQHVSLWWALPSVVIFLGTLVIGIVRYPHLPNRIAIHFNSHGVPDGWADKSIFSVLGPVFVQLLLLVIIGIVNFSVQRAAVRIDAGEPESAFEHQVWTQRQLVRLMWLVIAIFNLMMLFVSLFAWGSWNHGGVNGPVSVLLPTLLCFIAVLFIVIWAIKRKQQREQMQQVAASAKKYVHPDDDKYWKGGILYFNPQDPAIFVNKRFGIGWTFNFAHPIVWVILVVIIGIPVIRSWLAK
ncbi:DUF1648 domain-containing protein [Alicyclobacillus fodiniaquatilis]|uniref:DUF1648 domain-containing protein n=1 Tax=Alicyclobacillus fodiniaquatilis TaxID=1661150 RepID=A0ABW4JG49_9BACL